MPKREHEFSLKVGSTNVWYEAVGELVDTDYGPEMAVTISEWGGGEAVWHGQEAMSVEGQINMFIDWMIDERGAEWV